MKTDQANHRNPFLFLRRLRLFRNLTAVLLATSLVSCAPEKARTAKPKPVKEEAPAAPHPTEAELRHLAEQVERERELRGQAETRVASESGRREFWETLTVIACMGAVALFLVGTAIGSKGRRHAESA